MLKFMLELVSFINCFVRDGKYITGALFMAKVFQKDGKLKRKNQSQKSVLGVLAAKFRIGSAFLK
jgi:hypothetical protein